MSAGGKMLRKRILSATEKRKKAYDTAYKKAHKEQYCGYVKKHRANKANEDELFVIEHQRYLEKFREVGIYSANGKMVIPLSKLMNQVYANIGLGG